MSKCQHIKLNIGAGKTRIPEFINIDISERADLKIDVSRDRLPFEDNSVDLVFSYHTLEHVTNYLFALSEIFRVLKHGGVFLVGVPYVSLTKYNLVNPYHLHNFNEYSFDFFDPRRLKGSAVEGNEIVFRKVFHRYHYMGLFNVVPPPIRGWCRRHLLNVVKKIDFGLVAIKDADVPIREAVHIAQSHRRQFDTCMRLRVTYDCQPIKANEKFLLKTGKVLRNWWKGL